MLILTDKVLFCRSTLLALRGDMFMIFIYKHSFNYEYRLFGSGWIRVLPCNNTHLGQCLMLSHKCFFCCWQNDIAKCPRFENLEAILVLPRRIFSSPLKVAREFVVPLTYQCHQEFKSYSGMLVGCVRGAKQFSLSHQSAICKPLTYKTRKCCGPEKSLLHDLNVTKTCYTWKNFKDRSNVNWFSMS